MITFPITLVPTYYNDGFINIPVLYEHHFPAHGASMIAYLGNWGQNTISNAKINRTGNNNNTPRIRMRSPFRVWVQGAHSLNGVINLTILNPLFPNAFLIQ